MPDAKIEAGVIDKRISDKIKLTVLLATVTVVVRHSYNAHIYQPNILDIGPHDISSFVQLLNRHSTASAVPTFFLLSGYLFFRNLHDKGLLRKWNSRLHSLVIPYVLWNVLYLGFFLLVLPHVSFIERFSTYDLLTFNLRTVIQKLTIDPPSSHFWFVRDLIGFVALAPLLYLFYRRQWLAVILLTSLLVYWRPVDRSVFSSEGLFFFFTGGWAGYRQLNLRRLTIESSRITWIVCVVWLGLCVYQTLWPSKGACDELIAKVSMLMGVVVLWTLVDRIETLSIRKELLYLAPYSFFIYASHKPMVNYIYKVLLSLAPEKSQYYSLLVYVATPAITIAISVCAAKCILRYGGNSYSVLTGGRLPPHDKEDQHTTRTAAQTI
jgi:surface polysaccharide O-acyltransferase-like enzyme